MRLGVGALITETRDERTGRFQLDDGFTYQTGPVSQAELGVSIYAAPEVRVAYKLTDNFEVSAGLAAMVLVTVVSAAWDPQKEVDAAVDGIGAFVGEEMVGRVWFAAAPGLGARYAF